MREGIPLNYMAVIYLTIQMAQMVMVIKYIPQVLGIISIFQIVK